MIVLFKSNSFQADLDVGDTDINLLQTTYGRLPLLNSPESDWSCVRVLLRGKHPPWITSIADCELPGYIQQLLGNALKSLDANQTEEARYAVLALQQSLKAPYLLIALGVT